MRSCQRNPTNIGQPFFTGILGIFYAKPLHINRCLTWNDPSLCDVLYWFGIWSPPLAFFLFFRAFFSFFFLHILLPLAEQYRQALNKSTPLHLQQKQRSFLTFGFGASGSGNAGGSSTGTERSSLNVAGVPPRRESNINVNVTPTSHDAVPDTPEIRKYKKRFNSEVLCASLWGKFRFLIWSLSLSAFHFLVFFKI